MNSMACIADLDSFHGSRVGDREDQHRAGAGLTFRSLATTTVDGMS
jgi:hypothetical protein